MSLIESIKFCGATHRPDNSWHFRVWAPLKKRMVLQLQTHDRRRINMEKDGSGYFHATLGNVDNTAKYFFLTDGEREIPDPASNFQPEGVHGPSQLVCHADFPWTDHGWKGLPLTHLVLYELHVGTMTPEGTFEAIISRLPSLYDLGVNAIEIMPVAQFPGNRNWGYDGVFPYAVQNTYGGPDGLKKLVDACHRTGIAVILDVVYNHLGPEGNCLKEYGPYFTPKYATPWGEAINFDGAWCDGVRAYFCYNALHWFHHYHVDGLRLDAIHMMFDNGAVHFLQYLNEMIHKFRQQAGRTLHLIAESDLNSPRVILPREVGGYGFSAQWLDDFHHALYVVLDKKGQSRYVDFGSLEQLGKAFKEGFVHSGEFVRFRKRRHGASSAGIPGERFVAFTSNHDQVGNRPNGERLPSLIDFERLKLAAAVLLLSPCVPMLFMGEEYGEEAAFYYFISHGDQKLIDAVRKGRKDEFKEYQTAGESPDPQDEKTFLLSKLNWDKRAGGHHALLLSWYKRLLALRKEIPALGNFDKNDIQVVPIGESVLVVKRREPGGSHNVWYAYNFSDDEVAVTVPDQGSVWKSVLHSGADEWSAVKSESTPINRAVAPGSEMKMEPLSVVVYIAG